MDEKRGTKRQKKESNTSSFKAFDSAPEFSASKSAGRFLGPAWESCRNEESANVVFLPLLQSRRKRKRRNLFIFIRRRIPSFLPGERMGGGGSATSKISYAVYIVIYDAIRKRKFRFFFGKENSKDLNTFVAPKGCLNVQSPID